MARPGFPVPKDVIPSGSGRRGWVNCIFYGDTKDEVAKKKAKYFGEYPPQGYDTYSLGPINRHPEGYYYIKIRRWSTCD